MTAYLKKSAQKQALDADKLEREEAEARESLLSLANVINVDNIKTMRNQSYATVEHIRFRELLNVQMASIGDNIIAGDTNVTTSLSNTIPEGSDLAVNTTSDARNCITISSRYSKKTRNLRYSRPRKG